MFSLFTRTNDVVCCRCNLLAGISLEGFSAVVVLGRIVFRFEPLSFSAVVTGTKMLSAVVVVVIGSLLYDVKSVLSVLFFSAVGLMDHEI